MILFKNRNQKNKKAQFFAGFIVFVAAIVLMIGLARITGVRDSLNKEIGQDQINLISSYSNGENLHLYIDESLRYSSSKIMPEMYYDSFGLGCLQEENLLFWSNDSDICIPSYSDVSKSLRSNFAEELNNYLDYFKADYLNDYQLRFNPSDFIINKESNTLDLIPLDFVEIGSSYRVLPSSSIKLPPNFQNLKDDANNLIENINNECAGKEDNNEDPQLTVCIDEFLDKKNQNQSMIWSTGTRCESPENSAFILFTEKYNNCARSLDDTCSCNIDGSDYVYEIEQGSSHIKSGNISMNLELPFYGKSSGHFNKRNGKIEGSDSEEKAQCRLNDRSFKICLFEKDNPTLRLGVIVEDNSSPSGVTVLETDNGYEWKPSLSGDVKEYHVYIAQKGLPFSLDSNPSQVIKREVNIENNINYEIDSSKFDIKVLAVDFKGNKG